MVKTAALQIALLVALTSCKKQSLQDGFRDGEEQIAVRNTSPSKDDLTKGLVAYWPFNGNAYDASGKGNNGTVNFATPTKDRFGRNNKAYLFNGSTANIMVPNSASIQIDDKLTMACWIKPSGFPSNGQVQGILSKARAGYYCNYGMVYGNFNNSPNLFYNYTWYPIGVKINWEANKWHFVLISIDESGNSMQVLIDGNNYTQIVNLLTDVPQSDFNSAGNMITNFGNYDLYIGRGSNDPDDMTGFNGIIDEVRIYNRLLTVSEISALMQH